MPTAKANRLHDSKVLFKDGAILEMRISLAPSPVPVSTHRFKYSLFYGRPGGRIVLYDNERGKGDHRHHGAAETGYAFTSIDRLVAGFLGDVERVRRGSGGGGEENEG